MWSWVTTVHEMESGESQAPAIPVGGEFTNWEKWDLGLAIS